MNFPVIEMFHSIQGEGMYMGVPTIFVRVSGCNLRCVFKNSKCDTPYSSFDPETSPYKTVSDVVDAFVKMYNENPKVDHICITGGEPMLYQEGIDEFLNGVYSKLKKWFKITIETNGSINPSKLIDKQLSPDTNYNINLFSVSPKLSTSVDEVGLITDKQRETHNRLRINVDHLALYIKDLYDLVDEIQLKFVYSGPECVGEIEDLLYKLSIHPDLFELFSLEELNNFVFLMPEGITVDQMNQKHKECVEKCIEKGWKFAPRLHIIVWGDKRGV